MIFRRCFLGSVAAALLFGATFSVGLAAGRSVSAAAASADAVRLIEAQIRNCATFDDADFKAMLDARPAFRGLPVVDIDMNSSGEGAVWGVTFNADMNAVARAIPEASKPKRVRVKGYASPVAFGLEPGPNAGQTFMFCRWINPRPMD